MTDTSAPNYGYDQHELDHPAGFTAADWDDCHRRTNEDWLRNNMRLTTVLMNRAVADNVDGVVADVCRSPGCYHLFAVWNFVLLTRMGRTYRTSLALLLLGVLRLNRHLRLEWAGGHPWA